MGIPDALAIPPTPPAGDLANAVLAGTFVATGYSPVINLYGAFNFTLYGGTTPNTAWVGSVQIEKTFDGGTTWVVAGINGGLGQAIYASGADTCVVGAELERGVGYRLHCTGYTSGNINYRISTNGLAAMTWGIQG
jgi:hypothetical protein